MSNTDTTTQATPQNQQTTPSTPSSTTTPPATPPLNNSTEARNLDGSLRDPAASAPPSPPEPPAATPPEAQGAPPTYTDFKAPEGFTLDKTLLDKALPIFKDMRLPQDQAQKLIDWFSETQIAHAKRVDEAVSTMRAQWRDEVSRDPQLGPRLDAVRADIGKAMTNVLGPELTGKFKTAMDFTGAGDHPDVIRAIEKFAAAVNEGTFVRGQGPSEHGQRQNGQVRQPTAAQALYPTLPSSQR